MYVCIGTNWKEWVVRKKLLLLIFENIVPSLLNMCLDDVCYLILTELHTNQCRDLIDKKSHLRPIYLSCSLLRVYTKSCEDFKLTNMSLPLIERYGNWMRQFLILSDPILRSRLSVGLEMPTIWPHTDLSCVQGLCCSLVFVHVCRPLITLFLSGCV